VPRFVTGALIVALATLIVAPFSLITEETGLVRIEALLMARLELLSNVAPPDSWIALPEFRTPGPKFASELRATVSVPLTFRPAFATTPLPELMIEVPVDVKGPWSNKLVPGALRVAPFTVTALRNTALAETESEVAVVAPERTKLLAAVKVRTDCTLFARVTVVPANGVSMHTSSLARGTLAGFQFAAVVHCPSAGAARPVHRIVVVIRQTLALVTVTFAVAVALAGVGFVSFSVTVALFVIEPAAVAVVVRETEAVAPFARVPKLQVTVVVPVQVPWLDVTETNVRPVGSASVIVTPVELDGPLLVTAMVKVTVVP